ncbi:MAG: ABC transporter substrate-binding protein [Candidatus Dormibacterales bacterium]
MRRVMRGRWLACLVVSALGVAACGGSGGSGSSSGSPIKVGGILPFTGVFAPNAADLKAGWDLAAKDFGTKVDGHPIQSTFLDAHSDPNAGLSDARQLVDSNHVNVLIGPITASVGLSVRSIVASSGVPTLYPSACPDELATTDKLPNMVMTGWTCDQPTLNFGKYVYDKLGYHHVTTIGLDYAFGWQVIGGFVATFEKAGGTIDKKIWAPINTEDYSPYVSEVSSNTQAVFALMAGSASVRFTQAYKAFGLKGKIPLIGGGTLTDYSAMRSEAPDTVLGVITALQYADGLNTPENNKFVSEYKAATGHYPSYYASTGYTTYEFLYKSLQSVHGDVSKRAGLVKAFKTVKVVSPKGPIKISSTTNSPIQNIYIRKVEMVNGALRNEVIATIQNSPPWGPLTESEWLKLATSYTRDNPA